ncbi:MAG TPA: STAS domain-containing protein [Candidatus Acidoferrum sp.]|nr:STAS domain-containing protein [Candidatus Acidoferrum sp.]
MLKLTIHKLGDAMVFRCTGRIVFGECHILRHAIFSHPYITIAVLDMAQVIAMDAAAVGLLVELSKWAAAKRMQLKLLNLTPHVANLLNMTHVTPIFDVSSVRDVIDLLFRASQSSLAAGYAAPGSVANVIVRGL